MCGITGIIDSSMDNGSMNEILTGMLESIHHRGPDSSGVVHHGSASLGMTRLSIIDLDNGNQPIYSNDNNIVLFCNGEIYNHFSLKNQFCKDYDFKSKSDVEVIIPLFQKFGIESFNLLDGMFTIAILDKEKEEIILARDRFGIKPLYYFRDHDRFIYSSEIKSILNANPSIRLDHNVLIDFMVRGYSLYGESCWDNIKLLKPGSFLKISTQNCNEIFSDIYLKDDPIDYYLNRDEAVDDLRNAVISSVESQLMSDVPIGVFLSGGIDSSIIVGIISEILNKKDFPSFSVDFDVQGFSESENFSYVSRKFDILNKKIDVNENIFNVISELVMACDEPFGDPAALATLILCDISSKDIKVALSGDGSDEYMFGYNHNHINLNNRFSTLKGLIHRFIKLFPIKSKYQYSALSRTHHRQGFPYLSIYEIIGSQLFHKFNEGYFYPRYGKIEEFDRSSYLQNDILYKTDRTSMYKSLETRVPFLGNDVVNIAKRIPKRFQMRGQFSKSVLTDAFTDILDDKIIYQKKHGFTLPLKTWIKRSFTKKIFMKKLKNRNIENFLDLKMIELLVNQTYNDEFDHSRFLYRVLITTRWLETYNPIF